MDPFNGDFIQRHARAVSGFCDIHVIHVIGDNRSSRARTSTTQTTQGALTEQVICFPRTTSLPGKLVAHFRWQRLFRKAVRDYISSQGKPDLVHVHVPMRAGLIALWMKRRYGVPYVVTEHWGIYNDTELLNFSRRSRVFRKLSAKIFSGAAAFTTVSHFLGLGVNNLAAQVPYQVIPNVADTSLFRPGQERRSPFRFIHVSNMVPLKNVQGILHAFQKLVAGGIDAELVLVGDRDPLLRSTLTGVMPDRMRFCGEVDYATVAAEMQQAGCLVLFSDIENAPCVIGEALCCGLPVIATATGGIPEMVNGANGILVAPRDEAALTAAMKEVFENYARFDRVSISRDAQARYGYAAAGGQFAALYEEHIRS